jgi:ABC-2 type transport system permease protein
MSTPALADEVQMPAGGHVVTGPSAVSGDLRRFAALTRTLAVQDFKLKFFGSVLGYLWQLMRPLLLFGVLYVVFSQVVRLGDTAPYYAVVLLTGIVLFTFLAEATTAALTCVIDRENMVRKIHFPRLVIPFAVVLTAVFNLMLNLVAVAVFAVIQGVPARWTWLLVPFLLALLVLLATGIAMLLSALYVRYRDMRPIWDVLLQITFYASPILYPIELVAERHAHLSKLMMCSPFAAILQEVRHLALDPSSPSSAEVIGSPWRLLIPAAIGIGLVALGLWVFNREAPRIAEDL